MSEDHTGEKCGNCRFWSEPKLVCLRHAPIMRDVGAGRSYYTSWPTVFAEEWCGDWEARRT